METILVLVKFKVHGNLRFLSHAETMRVFQRACIRAGLAVRYSQGFNPRPKLSLPLPRSVGIEVDEDLLCLHLETAGEFDAGLIERQLAEQLPEGCGIVDVSVAENRRSPQARLATYVLALKPNVAGGELKSRVADLLGAESLKVDRKIDARGNSKIVDVREYIKSIEMSQAEVAVECKISSAGSIRVEEIMELLELDEDKLVSPVRRKSIQWAQA